MTDHRDLADARGPVSPEGAFGNAAPLVRAIRILLLILLLLAALVAAWRYAGGGGGTSADAGHNHAAMTGGDTLRPVALDDGAARRIGVTYAVVRQGTLASEVRTVAQVTFDESRLAAIAPKIDGWVEDLYVNTTGQPVLAGDPLLTIYSPMLVTAQEELLLARKLGDEVAGASVETRQRTAELREAARRRLQYWDISDAQLARLESTGEVTRTMTLRAPVGGVVIQKNVLAGQRIMAGDALYQVADLGTVWLEGEVFERDLAAVQLGQAVTAEFDALPGETRRGRITYLYPTLNPDTRTARVRVALANPGLRLKPGMYATLRITTPASHRALLVPRSAVLATGERQMVFVRRPDGKFEPRLVVTGMSNDEETEVLSGVALGDTVVRSATFLLDAESNLGSSMGGMGDMPGMDMTKPVAPGGKPGTSTPPAGAPSRAAPARGAEHSGHEE